MQIQPYNFKIFLLFWCIISVFGAFTALFDVDSAQYAAISMEMLESGNFLELYERGSDYLDKPPLLFWLNTAAFSVFGISDWVFKVQNLLVASFGLYSLYQLAKLYYDIKVAQYSVLFLAASLGFFWGNTDVKTDILVATCILFSTWQFALFSKTKQFAPLIRGAIGLGFGMMAKGMMGLVFPLILIGIHLFAQKSWRILFSWKWVLVPIVAGILLIPMCYGLYTQFDMQPEKMVLGRQGVSGLKFFFWEQSFGRLTGENVWKNETSFFYLFHVLFLLLFPFTVLFFVSIFQKIKTLYKEKTQITEYFSLGGTLVFLGLLSLSHYKIPQYALVSLPFAALLIASEMPKLNTSEKGRRFLKIHNLVLFVLLGLSTCFTLYCFEPSAVFLTFMVVFVGFFIFLYKNQRQIEAGILCGLFLGFLFNAHVVPNIHQFTVGKPLGLAIKQLESKGEQVFFYNVESRAAEFYAEKRIQTITGLEITERVKKGGSAEWYLLGADAKAGLADGGLKPKKEFKFKYYDFNRPKIDFFIPETREATFEYWYLVRY